MMEFLVKTPDDFTAVIEYTLGLAVPADQANVVTLTGDLGAGKTTFTQQLAAYLGILDSVVSPTFVVMKSYDIPQPAAYDQLVHIDAYRFEDEDEAGPLRLQELFRQPDRLICLEWPERISGILPEGHIQISIEINELEERKVTVST